MSADREFVYRGSFFSSGFGFDSGFGLGAGFSAGRLGSVFGAGRLSGAGCSALSVGREIVSGLVVGRSCGCFFAAGARRSSGAGRVGDAWVSGRAGAAWVSGRAGDAWFSGRAAGCLAERVGSFPGRALVVRGAGLFAGGWYGAPAALAATAPLPLKSVGRAVAATGGLP